MEKDQVHRQGTSPGGQSTRCRTKPPSRAAPGSALPRSAACMRLRVENARPPRPSNAGRRQGDEQTASREEAFAAARHEMFVCSTVATQRAAAVRTQNAAAAAASRSPVVVSVVHRTPVRHRRRAARRSVRRRAAQWQLRCGSDVVETAQVVRARRVRQPQLYAQVVRRLCSRGAARASVLPAMSAHQRSSCQENGRE
jgi:hypothetical protein